MAAHEQRDHSLLGRYRRTTYPLLYFMRTRDTAYLELFIASLLIAWGIALINPSTDTFRFIRLVTNMGVFDGRYEVVWGVVAVLLGGAQWSAVISDLVLFRFILSSSNMLFWFMCLCFFQVLVPYTLAPVISLTIVTFSLCISLRCAERYVLARRRSLQGSGDGHVQ